MATATYGFVLNRLLDSIKFPLKNIGQTEFNDFEVVLDL